MHILTIHALDLARANEVADELAFGEPTPVSVSIIEEPDEVLWRIEAHFAEKPETSGMAVLGGVDWTLEQLVERDWVVESLKGLKPVQAGRFFLHGAHDRGLTPSGAIGIEIEASLAFGTGHHGTTRGCLIALSDILKKGIPHPTLDLGCGSGVLAIAYARATRRSVLATDIDPVAVAQTASNARKNETGPQMRTRSASGIAHQSIRQQAPYQLIMANILARPLEVLAPGLSSILAPEGTLVLSGLTVGQERRVTAAYRLQGLFLSRKIRLDGWSTLILNR